MTTTTTTTSPPPISIYEFMQCPQNALLGKCCNGLESNCDLRVNEMMFATGHNLMSSKSTSYFQPPYNHLFRFEGGSLSNETNGKGALEFGYRGLNFDLCECNGQLAFCHNVCLDERDPGEIFTVIDEYLDDNPSEVVILNFQVVKQSLLGQVYNVTLDRLFGIMQGVGTFVDKMHVLGNATEWPLMKTLVENGEQIIAFHHEGPTCSVEGECPTGLHYYFDYVGESDFITESVAEMKDYTNSCPITRGSESKNGRENLYAVNNFLTTPNENVAASTNELLFIKERVEGCKDETGLLPNMVIIDFWSLGDLPEFTQEENKARAAATQAATQQA
mmetsp:Transcript_2438/g.3410  ORF Transcript_2438/g.3410 Transcript_2438/m.3410 type:complete len:333 (-) Transcript_2438:644-1642(-)